MRTLPQPTQAEVLANLLLGPDPGAPELPEPAGVPVLDALGRAMLPALERTPCLVSFSGGRDSSAILAVAVRAARRHGLPDPVPATMRFPGARLTDETSWQQLVIEHLGVRKHEIVEVHDELDVLGPLATGMVRRLGVRWPSNAYMHVPLLRLGGGALMTGIGGDELLGTTASRHVLLTRRRARPRARDVGSLAFAALPRPLREMAWRVLRADPPPWLTAGGRRLVAGELAREEVAWPHRWDTALSHWYRSRAFAAVDGALAAIASEYGTAVVNPLLTPGVLAELARVGGATGFAGRSEGMRRLFGSLLPESVLTREAKAGFTGPLWGRAARNFAEAWDGEGVDEALVDVEAVRREWLSDSPDFRSSMLLHAAWLHARRRAGQGSAASS